MSERHDRRRVSEDDLRRDLEAIGVAAGSALMVHSSLSAIGWVNGGPATAVRALLAAVGEEGTLAMPAATPQCAVPADWRAPEPPADLPRFERASTPTTMGAIAETFRAWPGTVRSDHPLESVCARGPAAEAIVAEHPLAFSEGRGGPFEKLHDLDCRILLLGVGFNRCTALHYAESLVAKRRTTTVRVPAPEPGHDGWIEVPNVADDNDRHFPIVGECFSAQGRARKALIGEAPSVLVRMRDLVAFATAYFDAAL